MEILIALIGLLGAIVGALLTRMTSLSISNKTYKNNLTYEIIKYFNSQEFLYILQVLQKIKYQDWNSETGKRLVYYFIPINGLEVPEDETMKNDLTVHQNLALYLRFLSQIYWYLKENAVNKELIEKIIIQEHFKWHSLFFKEFVNEYEKVCRENNLAPDKVTWYLAIKHFNSILEAQTNPRPINACLTCVMSCSLW